MTNLITLDSCSQENKEIYIAHSTEQKNTYFYMELEILNLVNNYRDIQVINFSNRYNKLMNNARAKSVVKNVRYGYDFANGIFNAWILTVYRSLIIEETIYTHFGISTEQDKYDMSIFTKIFIAK